MSDGKFRGVVHVIEPTRSFGQRGFRKRVVVVEQQQERFSNFVPFEFVRDACDAVDQLKVGDEVEIEYSLSGRRWQRDAGSEVKFFLSAEAAKFTVLSQGGGSSATSATSANDRLAEAANDQEDVPF
jgi:hypothetical protein